MREVPNIYHMGISHIVHLFITMPISYWIISPLVLYIGPFMEHFSIAETIGSIYGKYPRVIATVLGMTMSTADSSFATMISHDMVDSMWITPETGILSGIFPSSQWSGYDGCALFTATTGW